LKAELAITADHDVAIDVSKAKRRVAALRRKLDFPQSRGRGEQNIAFAIAGDREPVAAGAGVDRD
jgi:hypothetical protein